MPCIAGKQEDPREWIRFVGGEPVPQYGRPCTRTQWRTDRLACSSCPAFRGRRWDGTTATGLNVDGSPYGLTADEYQRWAAAMEVALIEDDFTQVARFEDSMMGEVGERTLRMIGDPEATERWAEYHRAYRRRMDDAQRERQREATRRRVARWRAKRRNVNTPRTTQPASSVRNQSPAPARAREARGVYVTEEATK